MPGPFEQIVIREIRRKRRAMAIPSDGEAWDRIAVELAARHHLDVGFVREVIEKETGEIRLHQTDEEFDRRPTRKEIPAAKSEPQD